MKKILSFICVLTVLLSLCFAGCGNISDVIANENEPEFSMGKVSAGTYRNDFLGLCCTIPQDWEFYSEEQLLQLNNIVGEFMDEEVQEQLKNANVVFDMFAQNATGDSSINVNMEKLAAAQLLTLDIQQVLESQIPTIISTYQNMGYTNVDVNYQKATVDGKELDSLYISAKTGELEFVLVCFTFRKANYLANVSVGTLQPKTLNALLAGFTIQ